MISYIPVSDGNISYKASRDLVHISHRVAALFCFIFVILYRCITVLLSFVLFHKPILKFDILHSHGSQGFVLICCDVSQLWRWYTWNISLSKCQWFECHSIQNMNYQIMQIQHGSHNERYGVSNHQLRDYLLSRLFRRKSKKTSKLRVTGLCAGNSPVTGEFPTQRASNAENVSIWWRHHASRDLVVSKGQSVSIFDLALNQVVIMGSLNISMG